MGVPHLWKLPFVDRFPVLVHLSLHISLTESPPRDPLQWSVPCCRHHSSHPKRRPRPSRPCGGCRGTTGGCHGMRQDATSHGILKGFAWDYLMSLVRDNSSIEFNWLILIWWNLTRWSGLPNAPSKWPGSPWIHQVPMAKFIWWLLQPMLQSPSTTHILNSLISN